MSSILFFTIDAQIEQDSFDRRSLLNSSPTETNMKTDLHFLWTLRLEADSRKSCKLWNKLVLCYILLRLSVEEKKEEKGLK